MTNINDTVIYYYNQGRQSDNGDFYLLYIMVNIGGSGITGIYNRYFSYRFDPIEGGQNFDLNSSNTSLWEYRLSVVLASNSASFNLKYTSLLNR